jgi:hypothetical protein
MMSMEALISSHDVDVVAEIGAIDALASTRTLLLLQAKTWRKPFVGRSKCALEVTANVEDYHKSLTDSLRTLLERNNGPSQRHFWNFFDNVVDSFRSYDQQEFFYEIFLDILSGRTPKSTDWQACPPAHTVIDGQHRRMGYTGATRDLSVREIRSILRIAIKRLGHFDDEWTVVDVLNVLNNSLVREVLKRVRWKVIHGFDPKNNLVAPSTREWVLGFFFRTGNPPPHSGKSCPAGRWAIVTITHARREDYATIQGQEISRNLRNTICEQRAGTRFNRGTQNYANHGGSWQSAGYRSSRPDHSLARCA